MISHLCNGPWDINGSLLGVGEHALGGIVEAEEGGTVDDDALEKKQSVFRVKVLRASIRAAWFSYLDGHAETAVQTANAVRLEDLGQAVAETGEFTLSDLADISCQPVQKIRVWSNMCSATKIGFTNFWKQLLKFKKEIYFKFALKLLIHFQLY